uniref:hypothetical protein n=1 Tax=Roseburia faecis TaxID=301302 RepID=UPI001A9C1533
RKRIPLNQNKCTADFRMSVPFEQNLHASEVEFMDSVKKAFVSRSYFKVLTDKLEEKRLKK